MVSFVDGLKEGLRNAYCSQVGNSPQWFANLREVLTPGDLARRGDALNRWVCNTPPDEPLPIEPPFEGGQCPGVVYRPFVTTVNPSTGAVIGEFDRSPGVGPWRIIPTGSNPCADPCTVGTDTCYDQALQSGDGSVTFTLASGCAAFRSWQSIRFEVVSGTEPSGGCGNPDFDLPEPGPIERDVDITYEGDDNTEYNLTVPVIFAPVYVALDGTLRIPISIGELNLNGEITLEPNFEVSIDVGQPKEGDPQPDDRDLPETDNPGDDEPIEPDLPRDRIIGVHVRVSSVGNNNVTDIFQGGAPNILVPRAANVTFAIRTGSLRGWTQDIPVKMVTAYVPCPVSFGAVDVRVTPEPGFTVDFTPVRGRPLNEFQP